MRNIQKKIEIASNVAIIVVALLFAGVLVNRFFFSSSLKPAVAESEEIKDGTKLSLPDVDWSKSNKNLVLILSTSCHFCTESTPFYQRLSQQKAQRGDVKLIAVFPQGIEESQRYLRERNISVDEVRQTSLNTINVKGTPTLVLVDRNGAVVQSWIGKLLPEKETQLVSNFLGGSPSF